MRFRKPQIALAAACLLTALLPIAVWIRSYERCDVIYLSGDHRIALYKGRLYLDGRFNLTAGRRPKTWTYQLLGTPIRGATIRANYVARQDKGASVPIWSAIAAIVLFSATIVVAPSMLLRFSVRAMFIIVTLAAVLFALARVALRDDRPQRNAPQNRELDQRLLRPDIS